MGRCRAFVLPLRSEVTPAFAVDGHRVEGHPIAARVSLKMLIVGPILYASTLQYHEVVLVYEAGAYATQQHG
jgi:hypothetical protein